MTITNVKVGDTFEFDGHLYRVQNIDLMGDSMLDSVVDVNLQDLQTNEFVNKSFSLSDEVEEFEIQNRKMQFSYKDGNLYYFIDVDTYDQLPLTSDMVQDKMKYISEDSFVTMSFALDKLLSITLPEVVELLITEIDDTIADGMRSATLETGLTIRVPNDKIIGQKVKINTITGNLVLE